MVDKLFGVFFLLIASAFLALLIVLRVSGELAGDMKVSAVLLCCAAIFAWIGGIWLFRKWQDDGPVRSDLPDRYLPALLKIRRFVKGGAVVGLILIGFRGVSLLLSAEWLTPRGLPAIIFTPVLIELYCDRILPPGAVQLDCLSYNSVGKWPKIKRQLVTLLLRVGRLGYLAIVLLIEPGFQEIMPWTVGVRVQLVESALIFLLYASQLIVLHSGRTRQI